MEKNNILSASMIIEKKSTDIPTNKIYKWIDDSLVLACQECFATFSLFLRKHHCRSCGRIFCYKCSSYSINIPEDFTFLHKNNDTDYLKWVPYFNAHTSDTTGAPVRVCKKCYNSIKSYHEVNRVMHIFNILNMDIVTLREIRGVCTMWKNYVDFKLNKFRNIQYVLPNHVFTALEKDLLWTNYYYIIHHPKYLIQLLKSIDLNSYNERKYKLQKIMDILNTINAKDKHKKLSCHELMCTRYCTADATLTCEDAISLLNEDIKYTKIREYAISSFKNIPYNELVCYIPFLIFSMKYEDIEEKSVIGMFLIEKCKDEEKFKMDLCNELYWELHIQLEHDPNNKIYSYFLEKLIKEILIPFDLFARLNAGKKTVNNLVGLHNQPEAIIREKMKSFTSKIVLPLDPTTDGYFLDPANICVKTSASMPIILPLTYTSTIDKKFKNVMFKFEDIRKDQIIMSIIHLIEIILKKYEGIDISILKYKVRPTGLNNGFIELVPNSQTIYFVKENLKFSLLNYILENNRKEPIDEIRKRFLKSCACYSVLTYILGIGDRHLDNIMITKDGVLFHIDYTYILGFDPKPMTNPTMRISADMIDVLGGTDSMYYKEFIELCTKIYNGIRRHVNLFIILMSSILQTQGATQSITKEKLYEEIIQRFSPGENYKQAQIQLCSVIETSSTHYKYTMIDFFHYYGKYQPIVTKTGKTLMDSIFGLFG
ncbi:MAG: phosphoinositide 3-kinase [Edafosvirus sp.]|uniref:Phosphoinositide 3-kinase n=1 Tax=Edafosvirus sp. TaxID=2487765 RepID=A0A3G4ZWV5_9VIRU|nr:MAG: phosphoinositide 3-kinase [Edafosvirus sp.]